MRYTGENHTQPNIYFYKTHHKTVPTHIITQLQMNTQKTNNFHAVYYKQNIYKIYLILQPNLDHAQHIYILQKLHYHT